MKFPVAFKNVTVSVLNVDESLFLDRFQKVFLLKSAVFFNWAHLRKKVGNKPIYRLTLNVVSTWLKGCYVDPSVPIHDLVWLLWIILED